MKTRSKKDYKYIYMYTGGAFDILVSRDEMICTDMIKDLSSYLPLTEYSLATLEMVYPSSSKKVQEYMEIWGSDATCALTEVSYWIKDDILQRGRRWQTLGRAGSPRE